MYRIIQAFFYLLRIASRAVCLTLLAYNIHAVHFENLVVQIMRSYQHHMCIHRILQCYFCHRHIYLIWLANTPPLVTPGSLPVYLTEDGCQYYMGTKTLTCCWTAFPSIQGFINFTLSSTFWQYEADGRLRRTPRANKISSCNATDSVCCDVHHANLFDEHDLILTATDGYKSFQSSETKIIPSYHGKYTAIRRYV